MIQYGVKITSEKRGITDRYAVILFLNYWTALNHNNLGRLLTKLRQPIILRTNGCLDTYMNTLLISLELVQNVFTYPLNTSVSNVSL